MIYYLLITVICFDNIGLIMKYLKKMCAIVLCLNSAIVCAAQEDYLTLDMLGDSALPGESLREQFFRTLVTREESDVLRFWDNHEVVDFLSQRFMVTENASRYANIDIPEITVLHLAVERGFRSVVEIILHHNTTAINAFTEYEYLHVFGDVTALQLACISGDVEMVDLLIANGADVHLTTGEGYSLLGLAIRTNREMAQHLVIHHLHSIDSLFQAQPHDNIFGFYEVSAEDVLFLQNVADSLVEAE